jgi:hypothetical protein
VGEGELPDGVHSRCGITGPMPNPTGHGLTIAKPHGLVMGLGGAATILDGDSSSVDRLLASRHTGECSQCLKICEQQF